MSQDRANILIDDIHNQTALGFSEDEIRHNLQLNGYAQEEITRALKAIRQNPAIAAKEQKTSYWSLLLSLFFIVRGIMYFSKNQTTLGFLMTGVGFIGFIIKVVQLSRR